MPAYSLGDAAYYLGIPKSTVRSWVLGQHYPTARGLRFLKPVVPPTDAHKRQLSFIDLTELHVLSLTRREFNVPMPVVRRTIEHLKKEMAVKRPLSDIDLFTDRIDLFVEHLGDFVSASGSKQIQPSEIVRGYLKRIERDRHGTPLKLHPLVQSLKENPRQEPLIEIDPHVGFGRPVLTNTGVRTSIVMARWMAHEPMAVLAADYDLPVEAIEEAIRYEKQRAA